jgi:hypothetical protein
LPEVVDQAFFVGLKLLHCTFLALAFAGLFWTCSKLPEQPFVPVRPEEQHPYFPLNIGKYIEYTADSIVYDFAPGGNTLRDSSRTWVREEIRDTFLDNNNQLVYRMERFERSSPVQAWQLKAVYAAIRTTNQAIRIEQNQRFLKLVFPFDSRTSWDGNLWIDQYQEIEIAGERIRPFVNWNYDVDALDIPEMIGPFSFDSVLVVTEVDETNAIERRLSRSKYAKHIGLVCREQWILDSQYCNQIPPPGDCLSKPWTEKAEVGYILRQVIVGYN